MNMKQKNFNFILGAHKKLCCLFFPYCACMFVKSKCLCNLNMLRIKEKGVVYDFIIFGAIFNSRLKHKNCKIISHFFAGKIVKIRKIANG